MSKHQRSILVLAALSERFPQQPGVGLPETNQPSPTSPTPCEKLGCVKPPVCRTHPRSPCPERLGDWDAAMMQTRGKENTKASPPCGRAFCLGLCNEIRRGGHSCSCRAVGDARKEGENWSTPDPAQVAAAMSCPTVSLAEIERRKDGRQATDPDAGV